MLYGWPGGISPRFRNGSKISEGAGRAAGGSGERNHNCAVGAVLPCASGGLHPEDHPTPGGAIDRPVGAGFAG